MNDIERELTTMLRERTGDLPDVYEPPEQLRRAMRARRTRKLVALNGMMALVLIVGVAALAANRDNNGDPIEAVDPPTTLVPDDTTSVAPTSVPTERTASCDTQAAASECLRVHADVDGDGATDDVQLRILDDSRDAALDVMFGSGETATYAFERPELGTGLMGVGDLDGDGAAEIAYISDVGAHTYVGTVIRARNGTLLLVRDEYDQAVTVTLDGAVASMGGFGCEDATGDGHPDLERYQLSADPAREPRVYRGQVEVSTWAGDVLQTGAESVRDVQVTIDSSGALTGDGLPTCSGFLGIDAVVLLPGN